MCKIKSKAWKSVLKQAVSYLFCKQQRSARLTFRHPVHKVKTFYISLTSAKLLVLFTLCFWHMLCSSKNNLLCVFAIIS